MASSSSKIVLAVGITALFTAVVLIAVFAGFLYFRGQPETVRTRGGDSDRTSTSPTPREKGPNSIAADQITKITFTETSMANRSSVSPTGYFSNINVQNYISSARSVTFSADGTATRTISKSGNSNGVELQPTTERSTATIATDAFVKLAKILSDNDFANEPDSKDITSLPIEKRLTITYNGGEKVIKTGHLDRNSVETSAMLKAFEGLEKAADWVRADQ